MITADIDASGRKRSFLDGKGIKVMVYVGMESEIYRK
jgi:hypothetical protein